MQVESIGSPLAWLGFTALILALLAVDLVVLNRKTHEMRFREALAWSGIWVSLGLVFGLVVWQLFGPQRALEYYTGYLIEESLSVDNLFVFIVLFGYFQIPREMQRRVLFWGILGALVMRFAFIFVGAALLQRFHWLFYVFGAFLVFTGGKLLFSGEVQYDPARSLVFRLARRFVPLTDAIEGARFFVTRDGRRHGTPLLVVLLVVEATDLVFALDSIPAIFGVTTDPFIVYSSNVFAILGLRSLYFVLVGAMVRFRYLNVGLAFVLAFIGTKMLVATWMKIPIGWSLAIVGGILAAAVAASVCADLWARPGGAGRPDPPRAP